MTPSLRRALWVTLLTAALLLAAPWLLRPEPVVAIANESGPLEATSAAAWLAMAALVGVRLIGSGRCLSWVAAGYVSTALVLAVRETGIPRWLVPSGARLLKLAYYRDAAVPAVERALTAGVILALLAGLLVAVLVTARYVLRRGGWRRPDGQLLLWAAVLLAVAQAAEHLQRAGLGASTEWRAAALALEEGLECLAPLMVCAAVWWATSARAQGREATLFLTSGAGRR